MKRRFGLRIDRNWDVPAISDADRRARMCGEKELRTQRDAETQAQLHRSKGELMRAYQCEYCNYWHIGHGR